MKAIVFDVDDTLYDLSTPFKETCREVFQKIKIWIWKAHFGKQKIQRFRVCTLLKW